MKEFVTGAIREDKTGKGRMDLLPMCALIRLSKHYEKGSVDHGERNWEKGLPIHSFIDSALRHLAKYVDGQTDEDHLCAAAWNILGAMWTEEKRPCMQDIPSRLSREPSSGLDEQAGTYIPTHQLRAEEDEEKTEEMCPRYIMVSNGNGGFYGKCRGTKEMDVCGCGGDGNKCDFY